LVGFSRGIDTIVQPTAKQATSSTRSAAGQALVQTAVPSFHGRNATHATTSTSNGRSRTASQIPSSL